MQREYLNITMGTDVMLNDTLTFDGSIFDVSLAEDIEANLVSKLAKRTALEVSVEDNYLVIAIPWVAGRLPGFYGLEVRGTCNGMRWRTYSDSLIRYTVATEPGSAEASTSADPYDITQAIGYRYSDSPLDQVTASVDNAVGTPTVITTYKDRKLDLAFHNLKGNGIASIEQTTESMEDGGLNVVTITDDLGNESQVGIRNGHGIVGPQGIQGESAVFDPETGNISQMQQTTGDSITNPMSQKAVTDGIENSTNKILDISSSFTFGDSQNAIIASTGGTNSTGYTNLRACSYTDISSYQGKTMKMSLIAYTTSNGVVPDVGVAFYNSSKTYISGVQIVGASSSGTIEGHIYYITIPNNAEYVRATTSISELSNFFAKILTPVIDLIEEQEESIDDIEVRLDDIEDVMTEERNLTSGASEWKYYIMTSNGNVVWSGGGQQYARCLLLKVTPGNKLTLIKGGGTNNGYYAWLKSDKIVAGSAPDWADGYSERYTIAKNTTAELTIPATANYLYIYKTTTSNEKSNMTAIEVVSLAQRLDEMETTWLYGKTVAILGDSISTNGHTGSDANVPEIKIESADVGVELSAYVTNYDVATNHLSLGGTTYTSSDVGNEVTFTPVAGDVGKTIGEPLNYNENSVTTWWEIAAKELGFNPIPVCWSGSSITSHEKNVDERKCSYAWHDSQIRKCGIRTQGTMTRTAPDVIIIYRGTNDMTHKDSSDTTYAKLTDSFFKGIFSIPSDDYLGGTNYGFKEGYALTITKLREAYPYAIIMLCTLNVFKRVNYSEWPVNNGTDTLPDYNNAIREVADAMGCGLIEFDKDGITFENCYPKYIDDSATIPTHPNDEGHRMMAAKAIADIKSYLENVE